MINNVTGKVEFTQDDSKNEVKDDHETQIDIKGKVIVKYVDIETKEEITEGKETEEKVGKEYKTEEKKIANYTYEEDTGNTEGNFVEGAIEVIYYYRKNPSGGVTVKYVDEDGNEIKEKEEQTGKVGDLYETEQKEIEDYEFVEVTGDEPKGEMTEKPKEVIYHYKKIRGKVIVSYLEKGTDKELSTKDTMEGKIGEDYKTTRKVIEGYRKADPEPENKEGTIRKIVETNNTIYVTYYYERIPSGNVITKYVDIDTGEELAEGSKTSGYVGDGYTTEEKTIEYYEYLKEKEPNNKNGTYAQEDKIVTYYYRKLPFNFKVEKTIKEAVVNGNVANISEDGKLTKLEVSAKKVGETAIKVKYNIVVTNTGEIDGTAVVADILPSGFTVSGENPEYWRYGENGRLETEVELKAKESKELEVVLDWVNRNDNFGSMVNKAEIEKTTNVKNFEEIDLNDNKSEAKVMMSIRTGKEEAVAGIVLLTSMISIALIVGYVREKRRK